MKKLMLLAALLAMMLVAAAPVMAQEPVISQEVGGQEAESGEVAQESSVTNSGDNVNQCAALLNAANTGNVQNAQAVAQVGSEGDVTLTGSEIVVNPVLEQESQQTIQQAAAAAS